MSQREFGKFWPQLPPLWDFPHPLNVHGVQVLFSWFLSQKDLEISHVPSLLLAQKINLNSSKAVIICTAVFVLLVSMDFLPEYVSVHCFVCVGSSLSRFYSCYMQGGLSRWIQIQHTQMWRNSSEFEYILLILSLIFCAIIPLMVSYPTFSFSISRLVYQKLAIPD